MAVPEVVPSSVFVRDLPVRERIFLSLVSVFGGVACVPTNPEYRFSVILYAVFCVFVVGL